MIRKILPIVLFFSIFLLASSGSSYADEKAKSVSASLAASGSAVPVDSMKHDNRAEVLKKFLEQYDADLASNAQTFVDEADKNNIDWKLVPAISGVESTFGQAIPYHCNNAWGYNIYGDHTRCFATYKDAITVISHDLRHLYMDQWGATDIYSIGHRYAASPTWAQRVTMFSQQIQDFYDKTNSPTLPISI
jgi:hypothetical protein